MIVRTIESSLRLITQNDHAHWAYQLLSVWPSLASHPRRQPILEATRLHDRGWHGIDATPLVTDEGRPHDFRTMPPAEREQVWRRGVEVGTHGATKDTAQAPASLDAAWRELLICHHAWSIHRPGGRLKDSEQRPKVLLPLAAALAAERQTRLDAYPALLADCEEPGSHWPEAGQVEASLEADYPWLGTLDFLSLIACHGWSEPYRLTVPQAVDSLAAPEMNHFEARFSDNQLFLNPFPLVGSYSLPLRYREVPLRRYSSDSELSLALARAPWQTTGIRVAR